jgi:hypothetical protein
MPSLEKGDRRFGVRRGAVFAAREDFGRPSPWLLEDLLRLAGVYAAAVAVVGACWIGVASTATWSNQVAWLVVSAAAVIVAGWGSGRWLLIGLSRIRAAECEALARVGALAGGSGTTVAESAVVPDPPGAATEPDRSPSPVWVRGQSRYHVPACPLVAGKRTSAMSRRRHEAAGRQACGVCEP